MIYLQRVDIMNKKCFGCGVILQTVNKNDLGYVKEENLQKGNLCERCFRIKNYGDYKIVSKSNEEYLKVLNQINKTNDLVVLVIDTFFLSDSLYDLSKVLTNPVLVVLSKRDILPKSIYEEKILKYIEKYNFNVVDKILISSKKNYQFDELYGMLYRYKKSDTVYIVGYTNAGKSTMINKLLYNYSDSITEVTTSFLPSTTLDTIEINLREDLKLVDTPGILENRSLMNEVSGKELKRIIPSKEIKPITYQIKSPQYIIIDNYAVIECNCVTNVTLFFSSSLNITRNYNKIDITNMYVNDMFAKEGQDIVISGLGFIKISKNFNGKIYTKHNLNVYVRDSLI